MHFSARQVGVDPTKRNEAAARPRAASAPVGRYAAAICWLYPSFIFFNFLLLTETLFTFLLVAWVLLAVMLVETPRPFIPVMPVR